MGGDVCAMIYCGGACMGMHCRGTCIGVHCGGALHGFMWGVHCRGKCGGTCAYGSPKLISGNILNNYSTLIIEAGFSVKLRAH